MTGPHANAFDAVLTSRQGHVLRAVVSSYVAGAAPVSSSTVSALIPISLSSASVRNTLAELARMGLVDKPHHSSGSIPSAQGLRVFVDQLLDVRDLGPFERRDLAARFDRSAVGGAPKIASQLLSDCTHQLGFVMAPRLDGLVLRHVSFVRISRQRVMAVLVSQGGVAYQRSIEQPGRNDQAELDRLAVAVNERITGRTLRDVRDQLVSEAAALRSQADLLLERALRIEPEAEGGMGDLELVIATRLALLDQPEFHDSERIRELFRTLEERERLVETLDGVLAGGRVTVALGEELERQGLVGCALVAAPYGASAAPLGVLGVIGPRRMDYGRIIPLVSYVSRLMTDVLSA